VPRVSEGRGEGGAAFIGERTAFHKLFTTRIRGDSHRERLDSRFRSQARQYDATRSKLLAGRADLYRALPVPDGGTLVDIGGGTGSCLEHLGDELARLERAYVVDACGPLLEVAHRRIAENGWRNVEAIHADAETFRPADASIDVAVFAYSLTMMQNWFTALEHAERYLRPGGIVAVVDFYVARKYPAAGHRSHTALTRAFWPFALAFEGVYASPDHVPYLHARFAPSWFSERRGTVPFFPLARYPYYLFIGRKRA
jgi:S-adenosylmethionine-diacylgycerolhomoserine-N-methlytransferase